MMTPDGFQLHLDELHAQMVSTITTHFEKHGLQFQVVEFLANCSMNLDEVVRGAMFFGAEVFPLEIPTK